MIRGMAKDLTRLSAVELARLIRTKKLSPVEVTEAHLAAIGRINPAVNAFCTVVPEKTLAWAREAEAAVKKRGKLGPLHGVPVAIKDLTATAGIRTTFGSTLYRDHVPTEDAEVVRRLKAAGAIVLGKTNTPEFGAGANTFNKVFGATRNPWNTALSASGSTGGGAAALAARLAPLAEGTDFGGSLRTPAAFCGVVGLRTTAGLVTRHPVTLPWHDQSVTGPMARSAEDCALLLDAMTGFTLKSRRGRARARRWRRRGACAGCVPPTRPTSPGSASTATSSGCAEPPPWNCAMRAPRSTRSRSAWATGATPSSRCAAKPWSATTWTSSSASASWATTSPATSAPDSRSP
jgi:Asp-tRNA(Asn)/Glu-tRNA(Gln) amidotransferase A subunit family amidase